MKIILVLMFFILILNSCSRECSRTIESLKIFPITQNKTSESSTIKEWYHSEFQEGQLNFSLEFTIYGGGEFCNYSWANYPVDSTIQIYCNKRIFISSDTILSYQNLLGYFSIKKIENDKQKDITYLLTADINRYNIQLRDTFYSFYVNLKTNDSLILQDSCVIKFISK